MLPVSSSDGSGRRVLAATCANNNSADNAGNAGNEKRHCCKQRASPVVSAENLLQTSQSLADAAFMLKPTRQQQPTETLKSQQHQRQQGNNNSDSNNSHHNHRHSNHKQEYSLNQCCQYSRVSHQGQRRFVGAFGGYCGSSSASKLAHKCARRGSIKSSIANEMPAADVQCCSDHVYQAGNRYVSQRSDIKLIRKQQTGLERGLPMMFNVCMFILIIMLANSIEVTEGVDCFKCSSRNGSNPACEDPFHNLNTTRVTTPILPDPPPIVAYHTPCYAGKKGKEGLFPASACIKLTGTFDTTGETLVVRHCALDSGTLTQDTELARMSHCGKLRFEGDSLRGCVLACPEDACNSAPSITSNLLKMPAASLLTALGLLLAPLASALMAQQHGIIIIPNDAAVRTY